MDMIYGTAGQWGCVVVAVLLQLVARVPAHELHWSALVHAGDDPENSQGSSAIAVGVGYYLTIGLRRCTPVGRWFARGCVPVTEHGCDVGHVSRELVAFGQTPRIHVTAPGTHEEHTRVHPYLINESGEPDDAACAVWVALLPPAATAAPTVLQIVISSDAYGIASTSVQTTVLRIPVLAGARIKNGTLIHSLGTRPPLLIDTQGSNVRWSPKRIPGVSPLTFFAKGNTAPHIDSLCVTVDDFRSHFWIDLMSPVPTDVSAASCQGGVGAVHTRTALIVHSPTGGIEEIRGSTDRISLSAGLADLCVDRLVVSSQPAPYRRGFNDIVLALEPTGWRRGTGTTAFVRDEPAYEFGHSKWSVPNFREILDRHGLNLGTWATQLVSVSAARTSVVTSVAVVGAAFALTQPRTFIFLICTSPSPIDEQVVTASSTLHQTYTLVAFDGLAERWDRRWTFDEEVRLFGLRYASSARPVLWAWGTTVAFSFDHGHSFHHIAGLPDHQPNNPVVDFASATTNEWALLYADGTVMLGCTDSQPRLGTSISTSSGTPMSLFFTNEGALFGLNLVCSDDHNNGENASIICAPKRMTLAHNSGAWEFSVSSNVVADAFQAGAYACDSASSPHSRKWHSTPSQDVGSEHMLREHISNDRDAESSRQYLNPKALPPRIFFDLHESYHFKLRLSANETLGASDWRPVTFQLSSDNDNIKLSVDRVWQPSSVASISNFISSDGHIEYTVRLLETSQLSRQKIKSGLSLEAAEMEKHPPGKDMAVSTLQILYDNDPGSGLAPPHPPATIQQQKQHTIMLLSGCPPGRRIEFDVERSRRVPRARNQQHVEVDHGCVEQNSDVTSADTDIANQSEVSNSAADTVACVWAGHDFYPVFRIVDDFAAGDHGGAFDIYNGSYRLTVVAGGPSLHEMAEYTLEQQSAYSMWPTSLGAKHSNPVYGFLNADLEGDKPTVSGMSWICSPGSPCSHVLPRFPNTPEIFLRFRFDTMYSEGTYCDYQTEFTLRLHGLPMAFPTIVRLTFGTTAACFGLLLLSYVVRLACFPPK